MRRKNSLEGSQNSSTDGGEMEVNVKRMRKNEESEDSIALSSPHSDDSGPAGDRRPDQSYAALITEAIKASPNGRLLLSDIYQWIETKYPYFKRAGSGWKNSVRHNLSLHRSFFKEPRKEGEVEEEAVKRRGRSSWWRLATPEEQQRQLEEEEGQRRRRRSSEVSHSSDSTVHATLPIPPMVDGSHHRPLLPKMTGSMEIPTLLSYPPPIISSAYQAAMAAAATTYFEMTGYPEQMVMPPPPLQQPTQQTPVTPQFLTHDVFLGALTPTSEGVSDGSSFRRMRRQSSIYWGGSFDDNMMGMSATRMESPFWPFGAN